MIHYGDITKISGYEIPVVDCVVGGSPCQNFSVAGNREGLDGDQSVLFVEQLRIIKEMRDKDARSGRTGEFIRPRFMVWENVPGAFSSNKSKDFQKVLEETAKIVDKDAVIPRPPKDKWTTSGCIVGDGWSIAWRVLDAQFWGVPHRRRRIALVADFGGGCAKEILFERKGLRGDSSESITERKSTSSDAEGSTPLYDRDGESTVTPCTLKIRQGCEGGGKGALIQTDKSATLATNNDQILFQPIAYGFDQGATRDVGVLFIEEKAKTIANGSCPGHHNGVVLCYDIGDRRREPNEFVDVTPTLLNKMGTGGNNVPVVVEGLDGYNQALTGDKAKALTSRATDSDHIPCVVMDRSAYNQGENAKFNIGIDENGVAFSHIAKGPGAVCYPVSDSQDKIIGVDIYNTTLTGDKVTTLTSGGNTSTGTSPKVMCVAEKKPRYIVRRLTPLECERLQGYEDGWTDIGEYIDSKGKTKKTSDTVRYKALGNSIALPPWKWIIKRLSAQYERDATLASLFDGIGGFPHLWEQINGKGSCLWASEIEDFPIAVTKKRI